MGETRVDLQHLLEDLRDAYSGAIEQTILTEVIANALDSGATRVRLTTDAANATLTVADDGRGMQRRELARYHDVAASSKARGEGIGFAGVGIKLGLIVSREVVTETRRGATHVATQWHLKSRHRAPWKWIPPPGLTDGRGTAVRLALNNPLSPLVDAGYVEETIRQHFEPLLDAAFDGILGRHYPDGVRFEIDGRPVEPIDAVAGRAPIAIRLGRRRLPSALGYLVREDEPLPDDRQGVAISTFGKVIKRGWDWLGLTPASATRMSGAIEAPDLAACLTLSKSDFIRTGPRGATYLAYRKAIQEVVSRQLHEWGDGRDTETKPRPQRLERDLARVLEDLATDFPLLRSLVDRRPGGQARLPMPGRGDTTASRPLFGDAPATQRESDAARTEHNTPSTSSGGASPEAEGGAPAPPSSGEPATDGDEREDEPGADVDAETDETGHAQIANVPAQGGRRRAARYGLLVQFESRPDDPELGRLVDSTLWINDAHPAYARAVASRAVGYHIALSVALALAPLAVGAAGEHAFITQFLAHWGEPSRPHTRTRRR